MNHLEGTGMMVRVPLEPGSVPKAPHDYRLPPLLVGNCDLGTSLPNIVLLSRTLAC